MLSTFTFVTIAWVFFRAENLGDAVGYITSCGKSGSFNSSVDPMIWISVLLMFVLDWMQRMDARRPLVFRDTMLKNTMYLILFLWVFMKFGIQDKATFIYFQF
jgi:hypothetical protein